MFIAFLALNTFAQTKSYEEMKRDQMRFKDNTSTLYIQLIGDQAFEDAVVKLRVVSGENKQFYVKDKNDYEILDQISGDVRSFSSIPDALDFLADKGFTVVSYTTVMFQDVMRHNIILVKTSFL
jgi:hypothetical protein